MFEIETKDRWTEAEWDIEDARAKALVDAAKNKMKINKCLNKYRMKIAERKKREEYRKGSKVPFGWGMGWDIRDMAVLVPN